MPSADELSKPHERLVIFCTVSPNPHDRGFRGTYAHVIHKAFPTDWGQLDDRAEPFQRPGVLVISECNGATLSSPPLAAVCPRLFHRLIHRLNAVRKRARRRLNVKKNIHRARLIKKRAFAWSPCKPWIPARCHHVFHRRFHIIRGKDQPVETMAWERKMGWRQNVVRQVVHIGSAKLLGLIAGKPAIRHQCPPR